MPKDVTLHPHLSTDDLERRYRSAHEPHERSWWQILWLLSRGQSARQVARSTGYSPYWIGQLAKRYNSEGSDGMRNRARLTSHRQVPLLSVEQQDELRQALVEAPPGGMPNARWSGRLVALWMSERLGCPVAVQRGYDYLQRLRYSPQVPRQRHVHADPAAQEAFKKKLRPLVQEVATAFPEAQVELWATDEHRIGLKPILRRVWAPKGHRPIAPVQHRYKWRYLVGFVHPASGRTIFHLATSVSIPLFEAELAAFARQVGVSPKKKIVLVLDRAGWHTSLRLRVPNHVYLHFLPSYSPELQPAEHLWPLTNAPLFNRHFSSIEDLEEAQAQHCLALQAQPALVRSTTLFHWWPQRLHKRHAPRRK